MVDKRYIFTLFSLSAHILLQLCPPSMALRDAASYTVVTILRFPALGPSSALLASVLPAHRVQRTAISEPLKLALVESLIELGLPDLTILRVHSHGDGLSHGKLGAHDVDLVLRLDSVVVFGIGEREGQHALLLQIGLVDTSERPRDDGKATEMSRLESRVLTGRTFAVVPVSDNDPLDALLLVVAGSGGHGIPFSIRDVLDLVGLAISGINSANQHVIRDVVEMTAVLEPRASHC